MLYPVIAPPSPDALLSIKQQLASMGRWRCSLVDPLSDAFILTALTVFLLAPQTCLGTTPAQPQQDVEQGAEIPNVKYTVITHNVARPAHRSDYVKMKDKNGKEFECVMPSKTTEEQDAQHVEEQKKVRAQEWPCLLVLTRVDSKLISTPRASRNCRPLTPSLPPSQADASSVRTATGTLR